MKNDFDETLLQNLDDFIKCYEFTDTEKVYTNGSKLIQVFRIKQWFDYSNDRLKDLEEENKQYKEYIKELKDSLMNYHIKNNKLIIYKSRNKKAIEYIKEAMNSDSCTILPSGKITDIGYCIVAFEDLLEILKGGE